MKDIQGTHDLAKVETDDKSLPRLPSANTPTDVRHAMEELEKVGSKGLKHVETVDKSAPKIDENVSIKKTDRTFLKDIEKPQELSHPTETKDRSAPIIDRNPFSTQFKALIFFS